MKWVRASKIEGRVTAPPSKSLMLRATAAALLSSGETWIANAAFCDDALAGLGIAKALGAGIAKHGTSVTITGADTGSFPEATLDCQESALCLRMFTPIAALSRRPMIMTGTGSLLARPMGTMAGPLGELGVDCRSRSGFPPLHLRGPLRNGRVTLDGSLSSQFLSGLLFALPVSQGHSEIRVKRLRSKPYVTLTLSLVSHFGVSVAADENLEVFSIRGNQDYRATSYTVEGDWSGASFLLVAGAIAGKVTVRNLQARSLQADIRILEALESANARASVTDDGVTVEESDLQGFTFDATDCPDLFPPLVSLACCCRGKSVIHGAGRLKHKESDRAQALLEVFSRIGARIALKEDRLEIEGTRLQGGVIDAYHDHRVAMAGAVAGLVTERGVGISGWECVSKSYSDFFEDLRNIGGVVE